MLKEWRLLWAPFSKADKKYTEFSDKICIHDRKFQSHRKINYQPKTASINISSHSLSLLLPSFNAFCFAFTGLWFYCWHHVVPCFPHLALQQRHAPLASQLWTLPAFTRAVWPELHFREGNLTTGSRLRKEDARGREAKTSYRNGTG